MVYQHSVASLMLAASILRHADGAHIPLPDRRDSRIVSRSSLPTPTTITPCSGTGCVTANPLQILPCGIANGTLITGPAGSIWTMVCDTDFYAQDIYPFLRAASFEACLSFCDGWNHVNGAGSCAGFVFAPDRTSYDNNCYLKSAVGNTIYPATIHLIGATLQTSTPVFTVISPIPALTQTIIPVSGTNRPSPQIAPSPNEAPLLPTVRTSTYLGSSVNKPSKQYVSHVPLKPLKLAASTLEPGTNVDLINDFSLASDTGSWTSASIGAGRLTDMTVTPRLSRDGGRGGNINGTDVFIFCDTATYGDVKDPVLGYFNGFVSSSVAIDEDMSGLEGNTLSLTNTLGQWQDDVGRMRGWAPMTEGEEAFNTAVSGQGYRYAVWPNSSPITLNASHALIYAPIVYLEVDMQDQSSPRYTSLGNTLLLVHVDEVYGPHADRIQNQFFTEDEINWGSVGGIRAWSPSGTTDSDGFVYLFGQVDHGLLLAKVAANAYASKSAYQYWNGQLWSSDMPSKNASRDSMIIDQSVMNMDLFYSPYHRTFIIIYLTPDADNTFYYRYLVSPYNTTLNIIPPYLPNGDTNYVEQLLHNTWSEQTILFTVPKPERGYIYAGGAHAGYFRGEDITNGGTKMLVTWTEHTKVDPEVPESGYAHKSQVVEFGGIIV